jgi:predicted dehydrogenase
MNCWPKQAELAIRWQKENSMDKVRIGVIGTGIIIRDYHMLTLLNNPRADVVAAGNIRPNSLQAMAERYDIPKTYTDLDKMAQDPDIDAVVIGLPNYLHAPVTIAMLEGGKHVLCEKPMAMSVEEGKRMMEAANRTGRRLMIGHMWRFDHEIGWLRGIVKSGAVGDIFKAKAHSIWLYEGPPSDSWFVKREYAGGGAMADMAVHAIDTLRYLLGEARPLKVFATVGRFFQDIELDDTANLMLEFEGGTTGFVEAGWSHLYADGLEGYAQVYGPKGYASTFPSELHTHVEGVWSVTKPEMPHREQQCDMPMYYRQMEHFLDCVINNREPMPGANEGLWAMRVLEAAYRSAEVGQAVDIVPD